MLRRGLRNSILPYKSHDLLRFVRWLLREEYGFELVWPPKEGHFREKTNNIKSYAKGRKYMISVFFDEIGHITKREWITPKDKPYLLSDIM